MVEGRSVDSVGAGEIGAERLGNALLSCGRAVAELGAKSGMFALVDSERGRAFR
jgi:hypothetical protein